MASTRPQIVLATLFLPGGVVACSGGEDPASAPESPAAEASTTVAPWVADANGPSLFEHVVELARTRAGAPWVPPDVRAAAWATELDYAEYRDIRYRPERAIWRGAAPFEVQLFHPGGANDVPVRIHLVEDGGSRLLGFDPDLFRYGDLVELDGTIPATAGYAGFRVLHEMNEAGKMDEVVSFLGASYFRMVGPDQVYGLSARGLAVDIAEPSGEEFPDFVAFWLVRPDEGAETMTFHALLDGPSVSGAYRFELRPGVRGGPGTVVDVGSRLFFRRDVARLGVAPLTSMYLHGSILPTGPDDFRPRVHDSEGLLMRTADGEWIWRPLTNRPGVSVTSLRDVDPAGFGLVQRTRGFEEYLDLEALYHRRPSVWVAADGSWGPGGVELLELPTSSEFNDNVVAYWVPDDDPRAGDTLALDYRLLTFDSRLGESSGSRDLMVDTAGSEGEAAGPRDVAVPAQTLGQVARTRIGWDALPGEADPPPRTRRRVVVDFEGGGLASIPPDDDVTAALSTSSGAVSDLRVRTLPDGGRRATFALEPAGDRGMDMRLFLQHADTAVTETWSYLWEPDLVR